MSDTAVAVATDAPTGLAVRTQKRYGWRPDHPDMRDYLMAVAGESTSATRTMWLYLSDSPSITSSTKWFFHNYLEYTIAHGAENVNFVTQCDGAVRLLHTSNPKTATLQVALQKENGVTNDITSTPLARQADGKLTVAFTDFSFSRGVFQNDEFCDFRSAANPYVTPSGKLVLYCASRGAFPDLNYRFGEIP